jgi:hypothetical protein
MKSPAQRKRLIAKQSSLSPRLMSAIHSISGNIVVRNVLELSNSYIL